MTYTDKKPTAPGYYWYRSKYLSNGVVISVLPGFDGLSVFFFSDGREYRLKDCDGQFAGPIPKPVEEDDARTIDLSYVGTDGAIVKDVRPIHQLAGKYQCKNCGHVCTVNDMDANAGGADPEAYSNWICPKCGTWHESLESGWTKP